MSVTRRRFLSACVGCAALTAASGRTDARLRVRSPVRDREALDRDSQWSSEAATAIAEVDRRVSQQGVSFGRTVRAVEDLGLDPTGQTPVNTSLGSALNGMSNTRIVFPPDGRFLLSGQLSVLPPGPIEFVGNGCSFVIPADSEFKSLTFVLKGGSVVRDIVIDQSAPGAVQECSVQAVDGVVRVDNLVIAGYAEAKTNVGPTGTNSTVDAMFSPIARSSDSVVRVTNFTALAGTAAGTHDDPDMPDSAPENRLGAPVGIWIGSTTIGKIQLINTRLEGWSNGIYGGRTPGVVEVFGGQFINNFNANVRVGGGAVVDGASILLDDRQWSKEAHPGPYSIGHQGVQAFRADGKHGDLSTPITVRNTHIVANSMSRASSLIDFESASGSGVFHNCLIENHLPEPVFQGESPRGDVGQSNILVENCLIKGTSTAGVMKVTNRPQSRIQNTCIMLPEAGPDDIIGAQIGEGVGFGTCSTGIVDEERIGSTGNLSSLPAPAVPRSGAGSGFGVGQAALAAAGLVVLVGLVALFGLPAFGFSLGAITTLISVYLFADE